MKQQNLTTQGHTRIPGPSVQSEVALDLWPSEQLVQHNPFGVTTFTQQSIPTAFGDQSYLISDRWKAFWHNYPHVSVPPPHLHTFKLHTQKME